MNHSYNTTAAVLSQNIIVLIFFHQLLNGIVILESLPQGCRVTCVGWSTGEQILAGLTTAA